MNEPAPPQSDYDDPKELYVLFGLAFYKANVLEHGIANGFYPVSTDS
jgi:hypothetical protein